MCPFWHLLHGADAHDAAGPRDRGATLHDGHRELGAAGAAASVIGDDSSAVIFVSIDVARATVVAAHAEAVEPAEADVARPRGAVDEGGAGRVVHVDDQHVAAELHPARVVHRLHVLGRGARVVADGAVLGGHGHVVVDGRVHRLRGVDGGVAAVVPRSRGIVLPGVGTSARGHEGHGEGERDEMTHRASIVGALGARLSDSDVIGRSVSTWHIASFNAENSGIGYKKALRKVELSHKERRGRD